MNQPDETTLLEAANDLRPRILAERERIEAGRRLPDDLVRQLARAGFFRIFLPKVYGGLDLSPGAATAVFEELARADASVAWCVWNGNTYWTTARWAKEVGGAVFADPDTILANSTRPRARPEVVEDGYRVSGRWSLVSGCQFSAWFILMCTVHEGGKPRLTPSGPRSSGSCSAPPPTARSWTPGPSRVCAALEVTMSWCRIVSSRPPTRRPTPTLLC